MNRKHLSIGIVTVLVALAVALTGCTGTSPSPGATEGIVSFSSNEPQNKLIPAITNEVGGGLALQNLFAMPIFYEADGSVKMDTAETITSPDGLNWTITLRSGLKFSDGSPLKAEHYVNAWQYAASDPRFENQWWFENFEGYNDGGEDADNPTVIAESLTLAVVDDTTFTVKLSAPQADFEMTLGYGLCSSARLVL